jgi:hypothetical protein
MEGRGGVEAQGVADPPPKKKNVGAEGGGSVKTGGRNRCHRAHPSLAGVNPRIR